MASKKRWLAIEDSVSRLKTPKEWPRPKHAFSNSGSLKTSELLLLAGNYRTNVVLVLVLLLVYHVY